MSAHTQGPWNVSANDGFSIGINAENESCFDLATIHNGGNDKEAIANARLIAASPDMLEAMRSCVARLDDLPNYLRKNGTTEALVSIVAEALDRQRAIIARVESA